MHFNQKSELCTHVHEKYDVSVGKCVPGCCTIWNRKGHTVLVCRKYEANGCPFGSKQTPRHCTLYALAKTAYRNEQLTRLRTINVPTYSVDLDWRKLPVA